MTARNGCLVHRVGPDDPCSPVEAVCPARLAAMVNPLVSLFRSMSGAAVEASERAGEDEPKPTGRGGEA